MGGNISLIPGLRALQQSIRATVMANTDNAVRENILHMITHIRIEKVKNLLNYCNYHTVKH